MAVPTIVSTYPNDLDTGIPIGVSLEILFDRGVDAESAKNSFVLYGSDSDRTSGPDSAIWIDRDTGNNPYFLTSPGFQGLVPFDYELVYVDLDTLAEVDLGTVTGEADETGYGVAGAGHKLVITPKEQLAADVTYNVFVYGDPDATGAGVSSRTVFDVEPDAGNTGTDGVVHNFGGYTGTLADTVVVEITTSGNIGTAIYRWYYQSAGVGTAVTGKVTSRRYRRLEDGLQIRFSGSGFVAGDLYTFNVETAERLATNTKLSFTTNDGSFTDPPDSPSTPATSTPPSTVLPPFGGATTGEGALTILSMLPEDRDYNVDLDTRQIVITFSEDVDPATITDSTVTLYKASSLGEYVDTFAKIEMSKKLTVSGSTVTIDF